MERHRRIFVLTSQASNPTVHAEEQTYVTPRPLGCSGGREPIGEPEVFSRNGYFRKLSFSPISSVPGPWRTPLYQATT
jgi:hypothetical protein